jgi:hypothetical protein|tara:strand:+ start:22130 stop:22528 length:399 start_codon:yes stop_codon:yes gene_type:complete
MAVIPSTERRSYATGGDKTTVGTMFSPNAFCYKLTVENASNTAIDLRAEDDAYNEVVAQIIREISPLAYFVVNDNSGVIHLVMDKNINSASELQARIRTIGKDSGATTTSIGPNDIDISGSDVVAASSITVA